MKKKVGDFLNKYFQSFSFFYRFLKYRVFIIVGLSLFVGVLDGIGLGLFLPLLQLADGNSDLDTEQMGGLSFIIDFFDRIGLPLTVYSVLLIMLTLFILKGAFKFAEGFYRVVYQQFFIRNLRFKNADALANFSYRAFVNSDSGRIQNTFSAEVERVSGAFRTYFMTAQMGVMVAVYLFMAFLSNPQFAVLISIGGVITNLLFKKLYSATKMASRNYTSQASSFQGLLIQKVTYFKYLKATSLIFKYVEKLKKNISDLEKTQRRIGTLSATMQAIREPLIMIVVIAVIIVQMKLFSEPLSAIVLSLLYFYRSLSYLMGLQNQWNSFLGVSGSLDNVTSFMVELKEGKEQYGRIKLKEYKNSILFQHVSVDYGDNLILKDINLELKKNETIALVGESGSGKTTLMNLMVGLIKPTKGLIKVDGIDYNEIDLRTLQSRVGYISQEPVVFNDTIFNNVTFWDQASELNKGKFNEAIRKSAIYDFVQEHPFKENAILGNNGINLSGGQRQRLSIARELYKDVDFLMMDEATSALDSETERAIQNHIDALKGQYTILIIAHRLSTVKNADRIVLLKNGEIQGIGSFEQLMNCSDEFKRMVSLQDFA